MDDKIRLEKGLPRVVVDVTEPSAVEMAAKIDERLRQLFAQVKAEGPAVVHPRIHVRKKANRKCDSCADVFGEEGWEKRHQEPTGAVVHAACCSVCRREGRGMPV